MIYLIVGTAENFLRWWEFSHERTAKKQMPPAASGLSIKHKQCSNGACQHQVLAEQVGTHTPENGPPLWPQDSPQAAVWLAALLPVTLRRACLGPEKGLQADVQETRGRDHSHVHQSRKVSPGWGCWPINKENRHE